MEIQNFDAKYITQANQLALENYQEERESVPSLPIMKSVPDVTHFSENGLGVCAVDGDKLLGFLGCWLPWDNAFDTEAKGTFSPCFAHGAVKNNRKEIYGRLYQAAGEKWVKNGILYHAVSLYAHDLEAQEAFFNYSFGVRCMDAMREMKEIECGTIAKDIIITELENDRVSLVRNMRKALSSHLGESPCFMFSDNDEFESWLKRAEGRNSRLFVAMKDDKAVAFLEVTDGGETFASEVDDARNICGAFCLPEYRGQNIMQNIINYAVQKLSSEGYKRFGVDFESTNPTAFHFWLKYFDGYTKSVTRRIDEGIMRKFRQGE